MHCYCCDILLTDQELTKYRDVCTVCNGCIYDTLEDFKPKKPFEELPDEVETLDSEFDEEDDFDFDIDGEAEEE